jgi:iron-sulfur cluster assembly accessory protein
MVAFFTIIGHMIKLSENTMKEIRRRAGSEGWSSRIIRVGIKAGGCSGTTYVLDFAEEIRPEDETFGQEEFTIVVEAGHIPLLRGVEVDFSDSLVGGGFRFHNPNADRTCGCGASFKPIANLESPPSDRPD